MTPDAAHLHPWPRRFRRLLGLPQRPCEPLDYSGNGRVRACVPCIIESPDFRRQMSDVRAIRAQEAKHGG
jgi:hypothetical protein